MSDFCDFCRKLSQELIAAIANNIDLHIEITKDQDFRVTASSCQLCRDISKSRKKLKDGRYKSIESNEFPQTLCIEIPSVEGYPREGRPVKYFTIRNKVGDASWIWLWRRRFAVWADEGSIAATSYSITTRKPILTNNPSEATPLIRGWLHECISEHPECKMTITGNSMPNEGSPVLPTRVLLVSGHLNSNIRLIESAGARGRYCVLSYCWGDTSCHPLQTRMDNLRDHFAGIRFRDMPKTFRDAVMITRSLDIDYLWIDSLCIVQGEGDDWVKESTQMGYYYENATLMIAAAGAKNPAEGCFLVNRPPPTTITAPIVDGENKVIGSFYISLLPDGDSNPCLGPLRDRGWAAQEWYLSRRKLFFMPGGISWSCKKMDRNEFNYDDDTEQTYDHNSWSHFLNMYLRTYLTYPLDRLQAIEGIANSLKSVHDGRYAHGLWEDEMTVDLLLWGALQMRPADEDLREVPSWSWAAIGGPKWWPLYGTDYDYERRQVLHGKINLISTALLRGSGYLRRIRIHQVPIPPCCLDYVGEYKPPWDVHAETEFLNTYDWRVKRYVWAAYDEDDPGDCPGMCIFDRTQFSEVFCWFMASLDRHKSDPCYMVETQQSNTSSPGDASTGLAGPSGAKFKRPNTLCSFQEAESTGKQHECAESFEVARGETTYWALLLHPDSCDTGKLKRVGLGLFYPPAFESDRTTFQEFEIV